MTLTFLKSPFARLWASFASWVTRIAGEFTHLDDFLGRSAPERGQRVQLVGVARRRVASRRTTGPLLLRARTSPPTPAQRARSRYEEGRPRRPSRCVVAGVRLLGADDHLAVGLRPFAAGFDPGIVS